jgi:serine/threonine protein kinase
MAGDRFCPLCDDYLVEELCPAHGVPTIAKLDSGEPIVKLDVGTVIAQRYRVERFLRQGGMGVVLAARQLQTDQRVVIKVLKNDRVALRNNLRRFYQEARVISRLSHPNIVKIFEFGFDTPTRVPFLAMELIDGRTIREIVKTDGTFSEDRAASVLRQVAQALIEAHDKGVLHRDLKPANIMVVPLSSGEDVKVLDFGLAKVLEPEEGTKPFTAPGQAVGTPAFMAPEQITQSPQDFRTDLYGLGCVLHVMLTGTPPFDGPDRLEVMRKQIREPPPPLPERLSDGRAPTQDIIALHRRLLMKNRTDRPASMKEVIAILNRLGLATDVSTVDLEKTETVQNYFPDKSLKNPIPEAHTMREELEPNTQPEVESFKSGSDSSTRLLHRNFEEALNTQLVDPSEKKEARAKKQKGSFADDEEAWTSVLPSTMESEPDGLTPVIDGDDKKPELAVHDLRALGAVPATALTPSLPNVAQEQNTPAVALATRDASTMRPMPSVGAIFELPSRAAAERRAAEKQTLFLVGSVVLVAILISLIAIFTSSDRSTGVSVPPAVEGK